MTLEMDIKRREQLSKEEGRQEGRHENSRETALRMLKKKFDIADIAECTGLSIEEIEQLAKEMT